ncbi:Hypothetical protein HVR_LOCUS178 [uncultured virus]|nr:Hypothetical protein HVR_LOCUS178 [uncultured virus]
MALVFTNVGEFRRGKGNRKTRLGPRIRTDVNAKTTGEKQNQTPDDIAIKKLGKLLDKPGLTQKDRFDYTALMIRAEQIRFMNMPVLAQVLLYMHNVGNEVTAENFSYGAIRPYIDSLLPRREVIEGGIKTKEIPEEELEIMRLRMAATFLRYIHYVDLLRDQAATELEEARIQQGELAPPLIDEL